MPRQRILVTGSSGVLGAGLRAIAPRYPQHEFLFTTSRDCDLRDLPATRSFVQGLRPDAILHLAAISGGIGLSLGHPASMLRDITLMTLSVLEAARTCPVAKTIMTLTAGMYPKDAPLPLNEDSIHAGPPHDSNYGSSFAKRLIDPAIRAYREEFGLHAVGLIPGGIFGEHDNFSAHAVMLPVLIRRFVENRSGHGEIIVWGDGTPLRQYTYAQDLAHVYLWALEHYDSAQSLNIGTTEEYTVKEIAGMVAAVLDIDPGRIRFDPSQPSGASRRSTDTTRLQALHSFRYTPFREALHRVTLWFAETYDRDPGTLRLHDKVRPA